MILHGPPGVGKTTIARIVAEASSAAFEELSAVSARVDDVRAVLARARDRLGGNGVRTLLFIDEIHRFDKRQQDSVLHAVEEGLVTLIGATTENPYFEVNQALLSRCTVIELEPLTLEELGQVLERGAAALDAAVPDDVATEIARRAGGDARTALQTLELAWETATTAGEELSVAHVEDVARKRPLRYDRAGDRHYDLASAFIKSMRGSDPDAAVYYLAAMLEGGEDPRFLARRIVIAASEDVGNADPRALLVAVAAAQAVEHVGLPEAQLNLAQAAIYVARAPKSNASAQAIWQAREDVRREGIAPPPADAARRALPRRGGARARRRATSRRTTIPAGPGIDHLPEGLRGRAYYRSVLERRGGGGDGAMTIGTGDKAPEFDLEETLGRPRVRLSNYLGRSNVLLVFHPFAFTAVCTEEAQDLQENLASFRNANTRDRVRLVRRLRRAPGLEARARRGVHVRVGLLVARRDGQALRRLQRGERRADPRHVPDRHGRYRDLVARQGHEHPPHRDGARVARDASRRHVRRRRCSPSSRRPATAVGRPRSPRQRHGHRHVTHPARSRHNIVTVAPIP